jgi:exopolyphosphatase/guanosine-5'-triphosphate,3'-diphosphate pyrophosphatase
MARYASIDVGTNSVLLLVAERDPHGALEAVAERAEITRLGRGVDATGALSAEGMAATLDVLQRYVQEARALGAQGIVVSATSAARDAKNGGEFLAGAKARAGVEVEIISGDEEARLSFAAAKSAFQDELGDRPLVVIDIGGGSTELIYGSGKSAQVDFRRSFNVGSVRLTERFVQGSTFDPSSVQGIREHLGSTFAAAPVAKTDAVVVGVAGTVTTLYAVQHAIEPYDPDRIEGGTLSLDQVRTLRERLCHLALDQRKKLPGLQPKRADVIPAGALILEMALERLQAAGCRVTDRGLRWGLLADRFGQGSGAR